MRVLVLLSLVVLISACSPKVGSEEWCQDMKDKPKKEWTAEEAKDFAKHCIFQFGVKHGHVSGHNLFNNL